MFQKISRTAYPPKQKPVMIWDGNCGFCLYWTTRWLKITKDQVGYYSYQTVLERFPDIDEKHFKEASRFIDMDGKVYSGPQSAYKTLTLGSKWGFLNRWYENKKWFTRLSDKAYDFVAKNRNFLYKVTKFLFGSDPEQVRPFWAIYLAVILYILYLIF